MAKDKHKSRQVTPIGANARMLPDNRWELLHSVSPKNFDKEVLVELLEALAKYNNDLVLQYKLKGILDLNDKERQALLKKILAKLSAQEFNAILHTARNLQPTLMTQLKLGKAKAATDKQAQETDDLHKKATKEQVVETFLYHLPYFMHSINEITVVTSDFVKHLNQSTMHHATTDDAKGIAGTVMLPAAGIFGAFQVGYDVALHNVLMRNAFTEYANEILRLDKKSIDKIIQTYKGDPDAQIEHIKILAKERMNRKLFNNTLYAGGIYSIFFAMILSFISPLPFIYAIVGMFTTYGVASKNRRELSIKIDSFMHQPELDLVTLRAIEASGVKDPALDDTLSAHLAANIASIPAGLRFGTSALRFSVLIWPGILAFSPLVVGIVAAINSAFTWAPLRTYLRTLRAHPNAAYGSGVDIDIERTSLTANFGRNYFKQYLLNEKNLGNLERELIAANIPIKRESAVKRGMRRFMSRIGIWEKERFNNILDSLYDGTNPDSIRLLSKLRAEAKDFAFEKRLSNYLENNHKRLGLDPNLENIRNAHLQGNSDPFYKLMRNYLEAEALGNVRRSIWGTGLTTTIGIALLVVGVGLTFFAPLAPFFAIAAVGILVAGVAGIYIAEKIESRKVRNKLRAVREEDFRAHLNNNQHAHFRKFAGLDAEKPQVLDNYNKSILKIMKAYTKPKKGPAKSIQDNLVSIKNALENAPVNNSQGYSIANNNDHSVTMSTTGDATRSKTLLTVPRSIEEHFNLHDGSTQSWQIFFALLLENKYHDLSFSLGTKSTQARAAEFVEALLLEFARPTGISCTLHLEFEDFDTAYAMYKLLQTNSLIVNGNHYNEQDLDKVRAHFGLILIRGQLRELAAIPGGSAHPFAHQDYSQNAKVFTKFMPQIQEMEAIDYKVKRPLDIPQLPPTRKKPFTPPTRY